MYVLSMYINSSLTLLICLCEGEFITKRAVLYEYRMNKRCSNRTRREAHVMCDDDADTD